MKRSAYSLIMIVVFTFIYTGIKAQETVTDQGKSIYINVGEDPSSIKMTWIEPLPDIKEFNNVKRPAKMIIENAIDKAYRTELIFLEIDDKAKFRSNIFTPTYLKNM